MKLFPTKELIESLFYIRDYQLFWKETAHHRVKNKRAGWLDDKGYRYIGIYGRLWQEHQLIFIYYKGYLPKLIDHKDRDVSNNHIDNLEDSNKRLNGINRDKPSNNTSGHKGVGLHKRSGKWRAYINNHGKDIHLGTFVNIEDAIEARLKAEELYFK